MVQRARHDAVSPVAEGFDTDEQRWIQEVWDNPGMQLMLQAYESIPEPVLTRVGIITSDGEPSPSVEGVAHNAPEPGGPDIEIADATYATAMVVDVPGAAKRLGTPEEEFKATLIHELFHHIENNTKHVDPTVVTAPETLKAMLVAPRLASLPAFAFGWFDLDGAPAHLDNVGVADVVLNASTTVPTDSEAGRAKAAATYEASPDGRSLEEDLATTMALYLTGPDTNAALRARFPRRFGLMNGYFRKLQAVVATGG